MGGWVDVVDGCLGYANALLGYRNGIFSYRNGIFGWVVGVSVGVPRVVVCSSWGSTACRAS
jgi:hypothetical protein